MKIYKKICTNCKQKTKIFSKGLCINCWQLVHKKPIKSTKSSSFTSDKQKERLKKYMILRDKHLLEHPTCEVCNKNQAVEIHHKKGRLGENLYNFLIAICRDCHIKIHIDIQWSKENNYLL